MGRRCVGDVGEGRIGRGRGSGCFMRPLTFTPPAFQSAVSIKDGCSSYVFPIHQRPRDTGPHSDGQLDMMEGERVGIRQGREREWKHRDMEEENEKKCITRVECSSKIQSWPRMANEKLSQGTNKTRGNEFRAEELKQRFALFKVGCRPIAGTV